VIEMVEIGAGGGSIATVDGLGRITGLGDDALDADVIEEEPAVEEEDPDEGYVLEDEDEELEAEEEEEELGPLGSTDEDY